MLAARKDNQYFLCSDNGMLGLLGGAEPDMVVKLKESFDTQSTSFISMSIFAEVACSLSGGTPLSQLGEQVEDYNSQTPLRATIEDNIITGTVIHIDSYHNALTNISRDLFKRIGNDRPFEIYVQSKHYMINKINMRYNETPPGELLAIFNAANLLEIAIRNGNAAGLLKLNTSSTIRVEFKER